MPLNIRTLFRSCLWAIFMTAGYATLSSGPVDAYSEHREVIMQDDWPALEQGERLLALPQIRTMLDRFDEDENISLEIRYPGGDRGRLWAERLAIWLVALGIPERYMERVPGSGGKDQLVLLLIDRRPQ